MAHARTCISALSLSFFAMRIAVHKQFKNMQIYTPTGFKFDRSNSEGLLGQEEAFTCLRMPCRDHIQKCKYKDTLIKLLCKCS